MVLPNPDVLACHDLSAALTDDDVADAYFLPIAAFDSEVLRI